MTNNADTLYYDGSCPLCSAEMVRLERMKDEKLSLIDIHSMSELSESERREMLTILHLTNSDGSTLTGLDANVAAWQHTRWGFLFRWMRWPVIAPIADRVYRLWAERRYNRMYNPQSETTASKEHA